MVFYHNRKVKVTYKEVLILEIFACLSLNLYEGSVRLVATGNGAAFF